ncbi:hypothetical protein FIE12Z_889 [Fusarium flagelliforme]|uniref:2EXR domain-containing protein n=1 Tax=Fusarium flagelliforme TaxID=2675880 RepID=A0A395N476_9HYPO|nr:hypothetical protein FIE12Z_889 [Fusarium flagelliforme]
MAEPPPSMSTSLQLNNIPKGGYKVTITAADGTTVFHQVVEHPSQITLNISGTHPFPNQNAIPATTFPKFSRLPPEIRVKIWKFSLDQPRIFWPNRDYEKTDWLHGTNFDHKPPAVRQVCRESRKVSNSRGKFLFGSNDTLFASLWFDFHSDIFFDYLNDNGSSKRYSDEEFVDPALTDQVRNVALSYGALNLEAIKRITTVLEKYPSCQRIIFVWSGREMKPYGDIRFYPISDDELLRGTKRNWGEIKTRTNRTWRKERPLSKTKFTEDQLPVIEAAECIFVEKEKRKKEPDAWDY